MARPKTAKIGNPNRVTEYDIMGLNEKQKAFVENYLFTCGMNEEEALKLAGYSFNYKSDVEKRRCKKRKIRELMSNEKVIAYMNKLRNDLNNQLIVDKFWVIKKLKELAEHGNESVQLKATELLGKTMALFTDKVIEQKENPGEIIRQSFEKRRNFTVLKKEGTNDEELSD